MLFFVYVVPSCLKVQNKNFRQNKVVAEHKTYI